MLVKRACICEVGDEVKEVAGRIALLTKRFAAQRFSEKLQYRWDVAYLQTRCLEFKRRVDELEGADDLHLEQSHLAVETERVVFMSALDKLLSELPADCEG
ncbi:MAG: hypothetical protein WCE52_19460 [Candidatus Acidiferrum sp.]